MRIMVIAKTLTLHRPGGFETHVTELSGRLAMQNKVDIVCRKLQKKGKHKYNIHDVSYPGINVDAIDNLSSMPAFEKKIVQLLEKNDYDVVHGQGITSLAYLRSKGKAPFVYTLHGISSKHLVGYNQPLRSVLKVLFDTERHCVEGADKIICVSKKTIEDANKYYGIDKNKCVYIPNGIDVKVFAPKSVRKKPTKRIGFVGYVHEHKGIHFLLKAMKQVKKGIPNAELYVVGNGDIKKFEKMAKSLNVHKNVRFFRNVNKKKLVRLYKTFDVFAFPSQYEGFGIAPLEAIASGVPIVVSDTGEMKELANGTGFVVKPDRINDLAGRIVQILENNKLRQRLARKCLRKAKLYDWDEVAKSTMKVYKEALLIQSSN